MLFHLIKKDVLIIKKYVFLMFLVVIAIPPFLSWRAPQVSPFAAFLISTIFAEFMLCQYVSMKETTYPKAAALLCAAPYPRSALVKAKYSFFIIVFVCCYVIYGIEVMLIPAINKVSLLSILGIFTFLSLIYGIYMPIQYKFGYEKTKFFFMIIIMASPFVLPAVVKSNNTTNTLFLNNIPGAVQYVILIVGAALILRLSTIVSICIYAKKELL